METNTEATSLLCELTQKFLNCFLLRDNARNNLMTVHLKSQTNDYRADRMRVIPSAELIVDFGDAGSMVSD